MTLGHALHQKPWIPGRVVNSQGEAFAENGLVMKLSGVSLTTRLGATSTSRTARCGPACRVVWQGSGRKAAPYADWDSIIFLFVLLDLRRFA